MRARRADAFADLYKRIFLSADEFEFPAFCRRTEINFNALPKTYSFLRRHFAVDAPRCPAWKTLRTAKVFLLVSFLPPFIWVSLFRVFDIVVFPSFFSAAREMSPRERVDRALTFFNLSSRVLFKEKKRVVATLIQSSKRIASALLERANEPRTSAKVSRLSLWAPRVSVIKTSAQNLLYRRARYPSFGNQGRPI